MQKTLRFLLLFIGIALTNAIHAHTQSQEVLSITIDQLETRNSQHGVVRVIRHSLLLYDFFPKDLESPVLLRIEYWNPERTELWSSINIDDNLVIDERIWEHHDPRNYMRTWNLDDMDEFYIHTFDVKNEQIELMMTLLPSSVMRTIETYCTIPIEDKKLGPLACKQIPEQP